MYIVLKAARWEVVGSVGEEGVREENAARMVLRNQVEWSLSFHAGAARWT